MTTKPGVVGYQCIEALNNKTIFEGFEYYCIIMHCAGVLKNFRHIGLLRIGGGRGFLKIIGLKELRVCLADTTHKTAPI